MFVCVPLSLMVTMMTYSPLDQSVGHSRSSILMTLMMASLITFVCRCMASLLSQIFFITNFPTHAAGLFVNGRLHRSMKTTSIFSIGERFSPTSRVESSCPPHGIVKYWRNSGFVFWCADCNLFICTYSVVYFYSSFWFQSQSFLWIYLLTIVFNSVVRFLLHSDIEK